MSKHVRCEQCDKTLSYVDEVPKFCSNCGGQFGSTSVGPDMDATQDFRSTTVSAPELHSETPKQIGAYKILRLLGRGGMGAVYQAEDVNTGRHVAVKILSGGTRQTSETIERFKREAHIAASISHARSTFVYSAGQQDDIIYIVMELMPGGTIKDEVAKLGSLPVNQAVDYMLDVIDGLESAHRAGIIHRDIKPSNCFVEEDGRVKVGDYGLSKSFLGDTSLTRTGSFMGTPQFAAAEQIKGGDIDERTDIYAIGCTLFYLLCGKAPFEGDFAKVIAAIAAEPAPSVRTLEPSVPNSLAKTIAQTLEKDPAKRPQTLHELRQSLLPFATQGSTFADIGRRFAAFFIDGSYIAFISGFFVLPAILLLYYWQSSSAEWRSDFSMPFHLLSAVLISNATISILYFTITESFWGRGVGKLIMGLRVTNMQGERPGILRSLIRALIIPGCSAVVAVCLPLFVFDWGSVFEQLVAESSGRQFDAAAQQHNMGQIKLTIQTQLLTLTTWLVSSLFLVTIRKSNGFRGVHEFLSGTRVQRDVARKRLDRNVIPIVAPQKSDGLKSIEGYVVTGQFNPDGLPPVYLARDSSLERNVWISEPVSTVSHEDSEDSISRFRATQQRWLDEFVDENDKKWQVWEEIRGAPIWKIFASKKGDWEEICPILAEVAEEAAAASKDGSSSSSFTINHVWIDENNQTKFMKPFVSAGTNTKIEDASSWFVLNSLCQQAATNFDVPKHFLDFKNELAKKPDSSETLTWAAGKLDSFCEKAAKWRWDDRMGTIAISAGLEQAFFQMICFGAAFVTSMLGQVSLMVSFFMTLGIVMTANFLIGFFTEGGIVFKILKLRICDANTDQVASRVRCAIRHLIAWTPFIVAQALVASWIVYLLNGGDEQNQDAKSAFATAVGILSTYPLILFYFGAVFAIIMPRRGLQDLFVRTRLMRE